MGRSPAGGSALPLEPRRARLARLNLAWSAGFSQRAAQNGQGDASKALEGTRRNAKVLPSTRKTFKFEAADKMEGCRGVQEGGKLQIVKLASSSTELPARGWGRDTARHIPAPGFVPPGPGCGAERASPGVWDVPIAEPDQWQDFSAAKKHLVTCQMRNWDFFKTITFFLNDYFDFYFFFLEKEIQDNLLSFAVVSAG